MNFYPVARFDKNIPIGMFLNGSDIKFHNLAIAGNRHITSVGIVVISTGSGNSLHQRNTPN